MKTIKSKVRDYQVIFYDKDNESHEFNYPDIEKLHIISVKIRYNSKAKAVKTSFFQRIFNSKIIAVPVEKELLIAPKSELKIIIYSNEKAIFFFDDEEILSQLQEYDVRSIKKRHLRINGLRDKIITHVANVSEIIYLET
jgi:hypothetical protein